MTDQWLEDAIKACDEFANRTIVSSSECTAAQTELLEMRWRIGELKEQVLACRNAAKRALAEAASHRINKDYEEELNCKIAYKRAQAKVAGYQADILIMQAKRDGLSYRIREFERLPYILRR